MGGFPAQFSSSAYAMDRLIAGDQNDILSRKVTILSGQNVVRGTVLGKITIGAATAAAKGGGNTGNGTCTMDGTTPILAGAQVGIYKARCTVAAANAATFRIVDPRGNVLDDVAFSGSGASVTFSNQLKFAIQDGSTDFVVGDGFDITVAAGSGKYIKSLTAAVDGSAVPDAVLANDCNASGGDLTAEAYFQGDFNDAALTYGTGHSLATVRDPFRPLSINIVTIVAP